MNNSLVELTLDDGIDESVAEFLINKDVECFVRENRPLTDAAYKKLIAIDKLCRNTKLYELAKEDGSIPTHWYKTSARKMMEDMLFRIGVDEINTVAVTIRVAFPFFKEKYDKEYKRGSSYEKVCSESIS